MKFDSPAFKALLTPELLKLSSLFSKEGFEMKIAGGAVRDLLMGIVPADVDFASTATPPEMKAVFEREGVRMLHKKGEEHGTITCRIGEHNFEITTLRQDVVCDGRRAEVAFTKDWEVDANRRDLTINALFLALDGEVVDYVGGVEDVKKRRVAFVGEAATRIQEDFLRILRYFRFFGRIALEDAVHEETTMQAIRDNKEGLRGVSAERIWTELRRIVIGRLAPSVMKSMLVDCGLTSLLGLPEGCERYLERYERVYESGRRAEKGFANIGEIPLKLESMTMVAALCTSLEDIAAFHAKTKLSNLERETGEFIVEYRDEAEKKTKEAEGSTETVRRFWRQLIVRKTRPDAVRLRSRVAQLALSVIAADGVIEDVLQYTPAPFPIGGADLMQAKVASGPMMTNTKSYLFEKFVRSECSLSKDELLAMAHDTEIPRPTPVVRTGKRKRTPTDEKK